MSVFAIRSERVVTRGGVGPATIVVDGERIASVEDTTPTGIPVEDVGALVVSPGLVDCHVHVNEPGRTDWEGFTTATRAAAAGGVTTIVDMPLNCTPVTTDAGALRQKLEACRGQLAVDVGFWAGVVPGNADQLPELAAAGVLGAKAFLCDSGIDDFPMSTRDDLLAAMPRLRDAGLPLLAHAELASNASECAPGSRSHRAWLESRPPRWEVAAIELLVELCRTTGCAVHIVHLSAAAALPTLRAARAEGLPITVETCPHYLCLAAEQIPDGATSFKCAPPIRDEANREALWAALRAGDIDFVISDHSPCTPGLKHVDDGDFGRAWGGISSLSLGLANVWTEARRRGFALDDLARLMSTAPAHFAGLADRKGSIASGYDADLCIWDPDATFEVDVDHLHFRHKLSPYLGRSLTGAVRATWLRGVRVFDGQSFGAPTGRTQLHRHDPT
ncbi:MAG: allantoinase AllB [Planctomycetes bacterium]|nr:allantoinase AllB [Planctomycetota bacterium]